MKAIVWKGVGKVGLEDVPDPEMEEDTDAVVRITASAVCGADLHIIDGSVSGMKEGTILGHEGVGIVEQVGRDVRNLQPGDRVVIPATIACGYCGYCRAGYTSQCDNANPLGREAGPCFFGGPDTTGPIDGLQAERACIPFANVGPVKLPPEIGDDQALLLSDVVPTGWFAAELAGIQPGNTVAVFCCGPFGQFAIAAAKMMRAGRVLAVDAAPARLEMARAQGAEVIDHGQESPVFAIQELTGGTGVDRAIDASGADVGPSRESKDAHSPSTSAAPIATWAIASLAKAGTLAVIGFYPQDAWQLPLATAMSRNITIRTGHCNHRRYLPELLDLVRSGALDPAEILSQREPPVAAIDAYRYLDQRRPGWMKVMLHSERVAA